jgi:mannose-1-phosphate guanylyltransferase
VAILPSDHYVSDDDAFMARVGGAVEAVRERVDRVVLLGIAPDRPEPEYGWIEPGRLIPGPWCWPVYAVERFWEKPAAAAARRLERQGCLWNSFVMVADPAALTALIAAAIPALPRAFEPVRSAPAGRGQDDAMRVVYASLSPTDLSRDVLQVRPGALAVLPVSGVDWNDLGDPGRVAATRARAEQVAVPA